MTTIKRWSLRSNMSHTACLPAWTAALAFSLTGTACFIWAGDINTSWELMFTLFILVLWLLLISCPKSDQYFFSILLKIKAMGSPNCVHSEPLGDYFCTPGPFTLYLHRNSGLERSVVSAESIGPPCLARSHSL